MASMGLSLGMQLAQTQDAQGQALQGHGGILILALFFIMPPWKLLQWFIIVWLCGGILFGRIISAYHVCAAVSDLCVCLSMDNLACYWNNQPIVFFLINDICSMTSCGNIVEPILLTSFTADTSLLLTGLVDCF